MQNKIYTESSFRGGVKMWMNKETKKRIEKKKNPLGFEDCEDQRDALNINPDMCHFE